MTPEFAPTIPGLVLPEPGTSAIEASAIATIQRLDQDGLLEPRHALTCQLILELARAVGNGLTWGKVSVATATLARQLMDAIALLPVPAEQTDDAWTQLEVQLAEAAARGGQ